MSNIPGSAGRREEETAEDAYYYKTYVAPIMDDIAKCCKGELTVSRILYFPKSAAWLFVPNVEEEIIVENVLRHFQTKILASWCLSATNCLTHFKRVTYWARTAGTDP